MYKSKGEPRGFLNPFELVADTNEPKIIEMDSLPQEMNALPGLIKNCLKKDSTTKIKALQGLLSVLSQSTSNEESLNAGWDYMVCYFSKIFSVCTMDESYLVRERAIQLLVNLVNWNKKALGKIIHDIIVPWLICYVDADPSVKRSARDIFHQVFDSPEKISKVVNMTQENIRQYIIEGTQYSLFCNFSSFQQEQHISSAHNILAICISVAPNTMKELTTSDTHDLSIHHIDTCLSKCLSGYPESIKKSIYSISKQLIPYSKNFLIEFCKTHLVTSDIGMKELLKFKEAFELFTAIIFHLYISDTRLAIELLELWINTCHHYLNTNPYYALHMILDIMDILDTTIEIQSIFTESSRTNICHCVLYLMEHGTSLPVYGAISRSQRELSTSIIKLIPMIYKNLPSFLKRFINSLSMDSNTFLVTGYFWNVFMDGIINANYSTFILSDILSAILDVLICTSIQTKPFYNAFVSLIRTLNLANPNIKKLLDIWISNPNASTNTLKWIDGIISEEYHFYDSLENLKNDVDIFITCFLKTINRDQLQDQWIMFSNILQKFSNIISIEYQDKLMNEMVLKTIKCPEFKNEDLFHFISHISSNAFSKLLLYEHDDIIHFVIESFSNAFKGKASMKFHIRHINIITNMLRKNDIIDIVKRWHQDIIKDPTFVFHVVDSLFDKIQDCEKKNMLDCLLDNISPIEMESLQSPNGLADILSRFLAEIYMNIHLNQYNIDMDLSILYSRRGFIEVLFWAILQRNISYILSSYCTLQTIQEYAIISSKVILNAHVDVSPFFETFNSIIQTWIFRSIPIISLILFNSYYPHDHSEIIWPFLVLYIINYSSRSNSDDEAILRSCSFICFLGSLLIRDHEVDNCSTELLISIQSRLLNHTKSFGPLFNLLPDLMMGHILSRSNANECFNLIWKWEYKLGHPFIVINSENQLITTLVNVLNKLLSSYSNIWIVHSLLKYIQSMYIIEHDIHDLTLQTPNTAILWWIVFLRIDLQIKQQLTIDYSSSDIVHLIILSLDNYETKLDSKFIDKMLEDDNIELLDKFSILLSFSTFIPSMKDIKPRLLEYMQHHKNSWSSIHEHIVASSHFKGQIPQSLKLCENIYNCYCETQFWINSLPDFGETCSGIKDSDEIIKIFKDTFYESHKSISSSHAIPIIIGMIQHRDSIDSTTIHSIMAMDDYIILNYGLFDHIEELFFKMNGNHHRQWEKDLKSYFDCWDVKNYKESKLITKGFITSLEWISLFRQCLLYFPSTMRCWWRDCSTQFQKGSFGIFIRIILQEYLYQDVVRYQIERLMKSIHKNSSDSTAMKVATCNSSNHELSMRASIPIEDQQQVEIIIRFPILYPLLPVIVQGGHRIGVSESVWRKWLFSSQALLSSQHGSSLLDGLMLWEQNTRKRFEGSSECAVCYCILQVTDLSLPTHPCKTCKNKFHSICLYKWFKSSGNSTCPLCRSIFST